MLRKENPQKRGFIMLVINSNGLEKEETMRESYKIFKFQGTCGETT